MKFSNISALIVLLGIATQEHVVTQAVQLGEHQATLQFTEALRHHKRHHRDADVDATDAETKKVSKKDKKVDTTKEALKEAAKDDKEDSGKKVDTAE